MHLEYNFSLTLKPSQVIYSLACVVVSECGDQEPKSRENYNRESTYVPGASPPPPSELSVCKSPLTSPRVQSGHSKHSGDSRFIIDPVFRQKTNLGTYVEGSSLVKAYRPRGPAPLPTREPIRRLAVSNPLVPPIDTEGHERYNNYTDFSLQDFVRMLADRERLPVAKVEKVSSIFASEFSV